MFTVCLGLVFGGKYVQFRIICSLSGMSNETHQYIICSNKIPSFFGSHIALIFRMTTLIKLAVCMISIFITSERVFFRLAHTCISAIFAGDQTLLACVLRTGRVNY